MRFAQPSQARRTDHSVRRHAGARRRAWAGRRSRRTINVAVIDTGIDYHHPELHAAGPAATNVDRRQPPIRSTKPVTARTSPARSRASNNSRASSASRRHVRLWTVKVFDSSGTSDGRSDQRPRLGRRQEEGSRRTWVVNISFGGADASRRGARSVRSGGSGWHPDDRRRRATRRPRTCPRRCRYPARRIRA